MLLGGPPGDLLLLTPARLRRWGGRTSPWGLVWEDVDHFRSFACATEHLACLGIGVIVASVVFAILRRTREDDPPRSRLGPESV